MNAKIKVIIKIMTFFQFGFKNCFIFIFFYLFNYSLILPKNRPIGDFFYELALNERSESNGLPSSKLIIILEDKEYMEILRDRLTEIKACLVKV